MGSCEPIYLGVDPGLNGGLAWMRHGQLLETCVMPTKDKNIDLRALYLKIHGWDVDHAFVEKVHAMPKQGVSSMFKFGWGLGAVEATLTTLCIPYTLVPFQTWIKATHRGLEPLADDPKERSALAASMLFKGWDFRKSERAKKPHDGMVDAALICEYGRSYVVPQGKKNS